MKKLLLFTFVVLGIILILSLVSAEKYVLNIKGELRTPDGQIEANYGAGLVTDKGIINSDTTADYSTGSFEIKGAVLDTDASFNYVGVYVQGSCFYHSYSIFRVGDHFEVSDAYDSERKIIISTKESNIDLGILKEDMSNQVMVDFDVPVSFRAEDTSGNVVAENSGFKEFTGMSNSFKSHSTYNLILKDEKGNEWRKTISTGDYCESTRVIKRGNYFVTETFSNNSFPPIGFLRNIWLSILGFRMLVIVPLTIFFLAIILILFFVFRKNKSSQITSI